MVEKYFALEPGSDNRGGYRMCDSFEEAQDTKYATTIIKVEIKEEYNVSKPVWNKSEVI